MEGLSFEREGGLGKKWKEVKKWVEMAAFAALVGMVGGQSAEAQEGAGGNYKELIRQAAEEAAVAERDISAQMEGKGQVGHMGQMEIRRWTTPDGDKAVIGYDQNKKAIWISVEDANATYRRIDRGLDGTVDRIILNKSNPAKGAREKEAFNDLDMGTPMEKLAEQAEVEASLDPQAVKIFEVGQRSDGPSLRSVDFEKGEYGELTGPEAEKLILKLQQGLAIKLVDIERAMK